ncbi:TonB-dependent siderophore receptor [Pseudoalteromonas ruthenica]
MMSKKSFTLSKIATLCAVALSTSAFAEQAKDKDIERVSVYGQHHKNYITEQADSASKLGITIKETPQSISVVSRALMDDFSLDDINAVLESTPGVTVEQIETDRTYFKARGFDITNFQVDGLGIPQDGGDVHGTLDTSIYDRIEIVRGANGIMTGAGTPAATVNMVLKKPTYTTQASASASVGSWNKNRLEVDVSGALTDNHAMRAVVTKQRSDSYLDRYATDLTLGYIAYEGQLTDSTKVSVNYIRQSKDADSPLWGALPLFYDDGTATDFDVSTSTAADWSYWNNDNEHIFVELEQSLGTSWFIRARYAHMTNEQDSELFYVYGTPSAETGLGLTGYASEYDYKDQQNLYDLYATGDFSLFGQTHNLVFGVSSADMNYQDSSLYDYTTGNGFPAMPPLEDFEGNAPIPTLEDAYNGSKVEADQKSAYASARFKITEPLAILAGGRYTEWDSEGLSYGNSKVNSSEEFIPYIGAVYDFAENYTVYASYTETFAPQSEQDQTGMALDPITGESKELGIKAQLLDGQLFATFAIFDALQDGIALPDTALSTPDNTVYYAAEGINSDGYELELSGRLTDDLSASFSYSHVDIEAGDDANEGKLVRDYTPEDQVKVALNYQVPVIEGLSFGANYRWQAKTSRVQSNGTIPTVTTQGAYGLLDLVATYQVTERISATFNVNNVTDEKYLHSLYWAQGYYGAPRHYAFSINWQL